jgi:hypothetical protein
VIDQIDENGADSMADSTVNEKQSKNRPAKTLPTDRVGFDKQLSILRGYAAASGPEKKAVSNADVSKIVGIHAGSISNCNPFFGDAGLLIRDGLKYRPSEEVFAYSSSYQWDQEKAALKLAPVIQSTWFAATLMPKLAFRSFTKDEAVTFLAEEAKASPEYKVHLELLLDYLKASGVVAIEGNMVATVPGARTGTQQAQENLPADGSDSKGKTHDMPPPPDKNTEEFSIPIPGKASAKIIFPKGLEAEDWDMLKIMLDAYIKRLRKDSADASTKQAGD